MLLTIDITLWIRHMTYMYTTNYVTLFQSKGKQAFYRFYTYLCMEPCKLWFQVILHNVDHKRSAEARFYLQCKKAPYRVRILMHSPLQLWFQVHDAGNRLWLQKRHSRSLISNHWGLAHNHPSFIGTFDTSSLTCNPLIPVLEIRRAHHWLGSLYLLKSGLVPSICKMSCLPPYMRSLQVWKKNIEILIFKNNVVIK